MALVLKGNSGNWLPKSVARLESLLEKQVRAGRGYPNAYALRKNLAYSLQHIEYLEQTITDLKLTTVLLTQTWKTEIIVGCGLIESLIHFLIVVSGNQTKTSWKIEREFTGVTKRVDGIDFRIDSVMKRKLDSPEPVEMTFNSMLQKAESRHLLGNDHTLYAKLQRLRPLRNKVHLQLAQELDHDYNAFDSLEQKLMMQALHAVFTGPIFSPSDAERAYFAYLERYVTPATN